MKAIILATAATLSTIVLMTVMFRLRSVDRRAFALLCIFFAVLVVMVAVSVATPGNLMFLPEGLLAGPWWFDLSMATFFYGAAFFGGVLQLYNLADRGFSLRILIDLLERSDRPSSVEALFNGYSQGKGMRWMYSKRITDILRNELVTAQGDMLVLVARGTKIARVYTWLRHFLNVEGC